MDIFTTTVGAVTGALPYSNIHHLYIALPRFAKTEILATVNDLSIIITI